MAEYADRIVEFLSSGNLKMGLVTAQSPNKLQVTDVNGRNLSLNPRVVVIVHPERCELSELGPQAEALEGSIVSLLEEIDTELLWESVHQEGTTFSLEELAEEYFGEAGSRQESAVFRAVLDDRIHFKLKGLDVTTRSEEQVAEQIHIRRVTAEREAFRERRDAWLSDAVSGDGSAEVPEEFEDLVDEIEGFLLEKKGGEVEKLLEQVDSDKTAKEAAFEILVHCGRLPEDSDPLLIIAGIEERFPPEVLEAAAQLPRFAADPERQDFSSLKPFSIDDPDTLEIDDALTVEPLASGWRVGIHIAEASHFVPNGGVIFEEAARRGATLYLPNRTVTMVPETLACELASLQQDELRPCFSVLAELDPRGRILDWNFQLGQLEVSRRLDYDQVDAALTAGEPGQWWLDKIRILDHLTQHLQQARLENGALMILKPELKIRVDEEGEISVKVLEKESPARRIVSELMILANRLAAEFASREGVPLIYRAQDPPDEPIELPGHYDPVMTDKVFKKLKRSALLLEPSPHATLGLDAYAQITSPIRRLTDLAAQQQLSAYLKQDQLPHDEAGLAAVQKVARSSEKDLRAVERKANRLFLLQYLDQHCRQQPLEAVVLSRAASGYQVETCEVYARGRLISPEEHAPGERVTVRIDRVRPQDDTLTFRLFAP